MAQKQVHVAVGVVLDDRGRVLVAKRNPDVHQGGLWEFPGGKVESGESVFDALVREFQEEVDLTPLAAYPLLKLDFEYPDKHVLLDVWDIVEFSGAARGVEGQPVEWRPLDKLHAGEFPAANAAIIRCLTLPREIAITPDWLSENHWRSYLEGLATRDVRWLLFRQKQLDSSSYLKRFLTVVRQAEALGIRVIPQVHQASIELLESSELSHYSHSQAVPVHIDSSILNSLDTRPLPSDRLMMASCHNLNELQRAVELDVGLALLSPVLPVARYGSGKHLGWQNFADLAATVHVPVLALGGLRHEDFAIARRHGAFGIAGISSYCSTELQTSS